MAPPHIEDKFFAILSALLTLPRERLDRHSSRENVAQWDSLKHLHLVLALEAELGVEFDDDEVSELGSAAAMLDAIASKVNG